MNIDLLIESLEDVSSIYFFNFRLSVFGDELVGQHVAPSNFNVHFVAFQYFDLNLFLSESVDTFRLSQEENLELLLFWIIINEVSKRLIDLILPLGQVLVVTFPNSHQGCYLFL